MAKRYIVELTEDERAHLEALGKKGEVGARRLRHRVEELFDFLKVSFGAVRTTRRAPSALPIPLLGCLLAYSL